MRVRARKRRKTLRRLRRCVPVADISLPPATHLLPACLPQGHEQRKAQILAEQGNLDKFLKELNGVADTVRQVEAYNKEMEAEIALTRRGAYKAEAEVAGKEKVKEEQDVQIDRLNERTKVAQEQIALLKAKIAAQREETGAAVETLRDAGKEMDTVRFEKQQLLAQWQSNLIALKQRDEALQATRDALRDIKEEFNSLNAAENNAHKNIRAAQDKNAQLTEVMDKVDAELQWLEAQLTSMNRQREALEERYGMLQSSLASTDAEVARYRSEAEKLRKEVLELEASRARVDRKRQELEASIEEAASAQETAQKQARNMTRSAKKVLALIHSKEMEQANVENELARIKVDVLNTRAHNAALADTLKALEAELSEKDALVAKYELEIRQRNDAIEKKMYMVDRLNRKYEGLVAGRSEEEHMGPLEATIHNTTKQIEAKRKAIEEMQKRWLADQTELVKHASAVESKSARLREMRSQHMLLDQKRIRMEGSIAGQEREVADLRVAIQNMHEDMARINALISKNADLNKKVAEANAIAEGDFREGLKEAEEASIALEGKVATLKEAKVAQVEELAELERQLVQWEKKIELEKEMQAALDPTVGESEVAGMEREIHRMQLRLDTLTRDQERLIREMERAIDKHEDIAVKYRGRKAGKVPGGGHTRKGLQSALTKLRKDIAAKQERLGAYDAAIAQKKAAVEKAAAAAATAEEEVRALEGRTAAAQAAVNGLAYDKQKAEEAAAALGRRAERYVAIMDGAVATPSDFAAARGELQAAQSRRRQVEAGIQAMVRDHPELTDVLQRVSALLDVASLPAPAASGAGGAMEERKADATVSA